MTCKECEKKEKRIQKLLNIIEIKDNAVDGLISGTLVIQNGIIKESIQSALRGKKNY